LIEAISITGILACLAVAWWKSHEARRAKQALDAAMEAFPSRLVGALHVLVEVNQESVLVGPAREILQAICVNYEDVNADGQRELLVQYPAGAHGSTLKIFEWRSNGFKEVARLGAGTPVGFEYGDFDRDGKIEIRTEDTDWTAGLPYVSSPRVELLIRWNGADFVEVSRKRL
jgi:hypothetical protein